MSTIKGINYVNLLKHKLLSNCQDLKIIIYPELRNTEFDFLKTSLVSPVVHADFEEFLYIQGAKNILRFLACQEMRPRTFRYKTGIKSVFLDFFITLSLHIKYNSCYVIEGYSVLIQ